MKKIKMNKLLMISSALLIFGSMPLTSCSGIFEEEGYLINDITWNQDEKTGLVKVTIKTNNEENPNLDFEIPASNGIKNIEYSLDSEKNELSLIISYTDSKVKPTTIKLPIINGKDGKSVSKVIANKDKDENITLQFVYSDNTKSEIITVPSGVDGNGISSIDVDDKTDAKNIIITINFTKNETPEVIKIPKAEDGVSVKGSYYNEELSTPEKYVITIIYSNDIEDNIELPRPKVEQPNSWLHGEEKPLNSEGKNGDYYLNVVNGYVYHKENDIWMFIFSMDGSGSFTEKVVKFHKGEGTWVDPEIKDFPFYPVNVNYGKYLSLEKFPQIERSGYTFKGWFDGSEDNINAGQFTSLTPVQDMLDLYPRWILN